VEHPRGEPQNPQSSAEFEAKYRDCAETAHYDEKTATRIKDLILDMENVKDITQLTDLCSYESSRKLLLYPSFS
jgi:2-methylcitrate dehydratase PrpD